MKIKKKHEMKITLTIMVMIMTFIVTFVSIIFNYGLVDGFFIKWMKRAC